MTFEIATEKSHCPKKDWLKNITVSKQMIILLLPLCWGGEGTHHKTMPASTASHKGFRLILSL